MNFKSCSFIKLCMMLAVILYHSSAIFVTNMQWGPTRPMYSSDMIAFFSAWSNTFHIYTFMAMAGYIFYWLRYQNCRYKDLKQVIINKINRLIVPYVVMCIIWVAPFHYVYYHSSFGKLLKMYLLGLSPSQLWFILALFWIYVIAMYVSLKVDFSKLNTLSGLVIVIFLYCFSEGLSEFNIPNIFQIIAGMKFLLFFYLGMILRRFDFPLYKNSILGVIAMFISLYLFYIANNFLDIYIGKYIYRILSLIISVIGVFAMVCIFGWIGGKVEKSYWVNALEEGGLVIYLFHQQFIYITNSFLNIEAIYPWQVVVINFLVSLLGSYLIFFISKKISLSRRLLAIK